MTLPMGRPQREIFGETVASLADDGSPDRRGRRRRRLVDARRHLREGAPRPVPPDGHRRAEHDGRRRRPRHHGPGPVHQHVRLVRRRPAAGPGPGADRPDGGQRQDHAGLRRHVHRPDRHEPHHRGRPRDHAGDARDGLGRAVRRRRGGAGAPLGGRVRGTLLRQAGARRDAQAVRRRPRVHVRQGGGRPRGQRRHADLHRCADRADRGCGRAARSRGHRRPCAPRRDAQAARRGGDRRGRGSNRDASSPSRSTR